MDKKFSRREVIAYLRNVLCTAGVYPLLPASLQASDTSSEGEDEHYIIFVELKGGLHYGIATECPDPTKLPNDPNIYMELLLDKDGTLKEPTLVGNQSKYLTYKGNIGAPLSDQLQLPLAYLTDGYFAALPPCFASGKTTAGYRYNLGWAASPLKDYVDKISVLRGVYMQGTFHGPANEEIYSGAKDGSKPHVAGVSANLLTQKYGTKSLDNLVLDGAAYVVGDGALPAVKLPSSAISKVVEKLDSGGAGFSLDHPRKVLSALQSRYGFTGMESIVDSYKASFATATDIKSKLANTGIKGGDISQNVKQQLDVCAEFFKNNLARVVTICTGSNVVFGNFDAHSGLYADDGEFPKHSKLLRDTLKGIADFIESVENGSNRDLKGKITLVVSSEYGRNNNFAGSLVSFNPDQKEGFEEEESYSSTNNIGMLGNGHFFPNNNYIFYGKGIKGGVWLGESDPLLRFPYLVKFQELKTATNAQNTADAFVDPFAPRPKVGGGKLTAKPGFSNVGTNFDPNSLDASKGVPHQSGHAEDIRALLAKDVVRTIMQSAGFGDAYEEYYGRDENEPLPAYVIKQLLAG